jgi:transposase
MLYTGIDYHKRYSVVCTLDSEGRRVQSARIDQNEPAAFAAYFQRLPEPSRTVLEACWNWGWLYDLLGELRGVAGVVLSHPGKTRLIAEAQIKTDRLDAEKLATLLRGNLVAEAHASPPAVRARKYVLRQRVYWVRMRTRLRNRVHALLARQRQLEPPACSDLFGKRGLAWLRTLVLPEPDRLLLRQSLEGFDLLTLQIKALETTILAENARDAAAARLQTLPGVGAILAAVIATELDGVARFVRPEKLCAYAGLVPTTHASGGKTHHGRLLPFCNEWLRWAFIEAAWSAVGCAPALSALYQHQRARGKPGAKAITVVARRLCRIAWQLLHEQRDYTPNPPSARLSPAAPGIY